ncbi:hypothetical protein L5515_005424 [Caenorhabditis briggsae]|uniref:Uncharacterized protein n=2 Tax=Caenorhabditis briggsae TaxID=6238 RepID=A0AAE9JEY1_CAEBR|nr:hypothetical protein L5515_005424 [Caenorhabditis briggsae]
MKVQLILLVVLLSFMAYEVTAQGRSCRDSYTCTSDEYCRNAVCVPNTRRHLFRKSSGDVTVQKKVGGAKKSRYCTSSFDCFRGWSCVNNICQERRNQFY